MMYADEERMIEIAESQTLNKNTAQRKRLAWIEEEENG